MHLADGISIAANFAAIAALITAGLTLFAEYHETGKWARNITSLLAGMGMLCFACALILRPSNLEILQRLAATRASTVMLGVSSALLLAAIAAFGIITYAEPARLLFQHRLKKDLRSQAKPDRAA